LEITTQNLVIWFIVTGGISIISIITGIITIIKSGKMLPKELDGADLSNKEKDVDIASKMDDLLTNAIAKAVDWQGKFDRLDAESRDNKIKLDTALAMVDSQGKLITIQGERILALEALSETQKCEIIELTTEVSNYALWTTALVKQLEIAELKPVRMEEVAGVDTSAIRGKSDGKSKKAKI
jgi:hypothetical protein